MPHAAWQDPALKASAGQDGRAGVTGVVQFPRRVQAGVSAGVLDHVVREVAASKMSKATGAGHRPRPVLGRLCRCRYWFKLIRRAAFFILQSRAAPPAAEADGNGQCRCQRQARYFAGDEQPLAPVGVCVVGTLSKSTRSDASAVQIQSGAVRTHHAACLPPRTSLAPCSFLETAAGAADYRSRVSRRVARGLRRCFIVTRHEATSWHHCLCRVSARPHRAGPGLGAAAGGCCPSRGAI